MNNKKLFLEQVEPQLQLVEEPKELDLVVKREKEQRELEMCLRSLSSRLEHLFKPTEKEYWN